MLPGSGSMLSHYRLLDVIGEGGMGVVYKAHDTRLGRQVALKLLRPELTADPERRRRFLREARAAAAVNHPNIATVHEINESGGITFIVMELVEGSRLSSLIDGRPLALDRALDIASQVADGMARAHQARVIHRDLKPDNIVIGPDGLAKILDFGLARILEEPEPARSAATEEEDTLEVSMAGKLLGTVHYMSPEQARGDIVDARSDMFSFGVILYEALTGRRPFSAPTLTATLARILQAEPEPAGRVRPDLPQELIALVHRCLHKDPVGRFADSRELARAVKEVRARASSPTVTGEPPAQAGGGVRVSPTTIAVLPFSVRGAKAFAYLGAGMVDLLSTKLDGAGELRSVDPHVVLCCAEMEEGVPPDPERARAIAHRFGAGLFVLGSILEIGGLLHVDASLYDATGDMEIVAKASARGAASEIFEMVDRLTAELLTTRCGGPGTRFVRMAAMATDSFPALKAYLEAETEMRMSRRVEAAEAYGRAVAIDPAFALAWYRLAVAELWSGRSERARIAAGRAAALNARLSERDRHLLDAFEAALRGDNEDAQMRFRSIVGTYPDDAEAWYQLGELQFHCGPLGGRCVGDSREAWERLISLDPRHVAGLAHLAVVESSVKNRAEVQLHARRVLQLSDRGDHATCLRASLAFAAADPAARREIVEQLRQASDYTVVLAVQYVGPFMGHVPGAIALAGVLTEPMRSPEVRGLGHIMRAHLEMARGRRRAARRELQEAASLEPVAARHHLALLACGTVAGVPRAEVEEIRDELVRLEPAPATGPSGVAPRAWLAPHQGLQAHLRLYLLGLLDARLGRRDDALRWVDELEKLDAPGGSEAFVLDLGLGARAQCASIAGRPEEALALLEGTRRQARFDVVMWSPFYSQGHERWMRAELLRQLGRLDEALSWLGSFSETSIYSQMYVAPAHLRRAEICAPLGRAEEAREHYARVLELWGDCEEELEPLLMQIRSDRDRLGR